MKHIFKTFICVLSGIALYLFFQYFLNPDAEHAKSVIITGSSGFMTITMYYCLFTKSNKYKERKTK